MDRHTFWDGEKCNENKGIAMSTTYIILYIPDGEVQRIILIISCTNGYSSFVATKNDGNQHSTVVFLVLLGNSVL